MLSCGKKEDCCHIYLIFPRIDQANRFVALRNRVDKLKALRLLQQVLISYSLCRSSSTLVLAYVGPIVMIPLKPLGLTIHFLNSSSLFLVVICFAAFSISLAPLHFCHPRTKNAPRSATPRPGTGTPNAQIEATCTVTQLIFHGHQMPWMLSNYNCFQSCADGCDVWQLQHSSV